MSMKIEYLGSYDSERMFGLLQRKQTKINSRRNELTTEQLKSIWQAKIESGVLWFGDGIPEVSAFLDNMEVCWYTQLPIERSEYLTDNMYGRYFRTSERIFTCDIEMVGLSHRGELIKLSEIPTAYSWFPPDVSVENLHFNVTEFKDLVAFYSL